MAAQYGATEGWGAFVKLFGGGKASIKVQTSEPEAIRMIFGSPPVW